MNLLKSFSLTSNIEPGKSFIYDRLFPLDFENYIILETQSSQANFHYSFWHRTLELIDPFFKEANIKIIHFVEDGSYSFDHFFVKNSIPINEKAYLLKRAKFFCGSSKLYSLICSENNINQCFLKTDYSLENTLCPEEQIIHSSGLARNFTNFTTTPINNIRPETIAKRIIKACFDKDVEFENSLFVGALFSNSVLDLIPNCFFNLHVKEGDRPANIVVRMDLLFSEENLEQQLNAWPSVIVTNRAINKNILIKYKDRIPKVFFKVEKKSDSNFLKTLESLKIAYEVASSLPNKDLNKEKIKYLNYKKVHKIKSFNVDFLNGLDLSKVFFKTTKGTVKNGKIYPSKWHEKVGLNCSTEFMKERFPIPSVINQSFKEDLDFFYILTSEVL